MGRQATTAAVLALAIAGPALAAPPEPSPTVSALTVTASKTVSELIVTAHGKCLGPESYSERAQRPKVVSTYPSRGSLVRPGLLVVRVTFDQPMACAGGFASAAPLPNPCPGAPREMLLSYDRRTVRTVCAVDAGAAYGLWMSRDLADRSFIGLTGLPAQPYRLNFATSTEPPVTTVCAALVADTVSAAQLRARGNPECPGEPASEAR